MVSSSPVNAALHPGRDQTSTDTALTELPLSPAIPVEWSPLAALDRWLRSAILGLLLCAWLCTGAGSSGGVMGQGLRLRAQPIAQGLLG